MLNKTLVAAALVAIGALAADGGARAQEPEPQQNRQQELEQARQQLEQARRELEAAAREVARFSAGADRPFVGEMTTALRVPFSRAALGISLAIEDAPNGAQVLGVTPGGAAAEAGVAAGDVITAIDGVDLAAGDRSASDRLIEHMAGIEPGQAVALRILRDGEPREISVEARAPDRGVFFFGRPGSAAATALPGVPAVPGVPLPEGGVAVWNGVAPSIMRFELFRGAPWRDLELVPLTEELGSYFGTDEGLLVVRAPEDDEIGLRDGDVILEIGGRTPTTPEHAMRILMSFDAGETLQLTIMRRERRETLEYTIPEAGRAG